uniref:EGF-like domain-containing protein n=1 Tax=Panagrolaimus davidi TaxID=227884 RepID=A0A914Q732_9BILA
MFSFLILFLLFLSIEAHIGFVYPAARYPPLDFLQISRTISPCGLPQGRNPYYTSFAVGRPYDLTWTANHDLHKGGIRMTLLDSNGNRLQQLFPQQTNLWMSYPERIPVNLTITFPRPCRGCILQIERQALDINDTFHSCADINVEQFLQNTDQIQCSGNGRLTQSGCICLKYFIGDRCQYRTDCEDNSDCLNGQCVTDSRPGLIQKFCYCDFSFFGKNCEIQSNIQNLNDECFNYKNLIDRNSAMFKAYGIFNPDCYDQRKDLNHEDFVYSRLIGVS